MFGATPNGTPIKCARMSFADAVTCLQTTVSFAAEECNSLAILDTYETTAFKVSCGLEGAEITSGYGVSGKASQRAINGRTTAEC